MKFKSLSTFGLVGFLSFVSGGWLLQDRGAPDTDAYRQARLFDDVVAYVSRYYVDSISEAELYDLAIDGMLNRLGDPYTNFLRPEDFEDLTLSTTGNYAGIGVQIDSRNGFIVVVTTFADGPGERLGLQPGDEFVEIAGQDAEGWSIQRASGTLRGEPGTKVKVKIRRRGSPEPVEFEITRAPIHVNSVDGVMMLNDEVGYMQLTTVSEVSGREVVQSILDLREGGAKSLILDLRNNPGGILQQGVALADLFLDSGSVVVETRGRAPGATQTFVTRNFQPWPDMELVVLVNERTASAAEIFSGALQDHDRAAILGNTTFGKGVAYVVIELPGNHALSVTSSRWYTPVGRSIQRGRERRSDAAPVALLGAAGAETESDADSIYMSFGGRRLGGGGGIVPDIVVLDTLTDGEQQFATELGNEVPKYFNAIVEYAAEVLRNREITHRDFTVTDEMVTQVRARLADAGVEVSEPAWAGAWELTRQRLGYELARFSIGRSAELWRRANDDVIVRQAVELLTASSSQAALLTALEERSGL